VTGQPIPISHIFFDVDGTLVDFRSSLRRGLNAASEVLSQHAGALITPAALEEARARVARSHRGTLAAIREQSFRQILRERGVADEAAVTEATGRFFDARDAALEPYDDVVEAVATLRDRGFVLVAATNGNAALMRTPVFDLLHHTWSAEEAGVAKPHPGFYRAALAKVGAEASRSLMVGDRMDNDIEPAHSVGMPAVLLDRPGVIDGVPHPARAVVRSLGELPALVERAES
jgi:FMN hydrolase / 5-amino-6-(5-phospho-D-ribitylamino)uracil phosphatase